MRKGYPGNGSATTNAWWQPGLPHYQHSQPDLRAVPSANDMDIQPAIGFSMPSWNPGGPCNVFFPGTYQTMS